MRDRMEMRDKTFAFVCFIVVITFGPFMCFHASLSFKQGLVYSHFADDIVNGHSEVSEMAEKWRVEDICSKFSPYSLGCGYEGISHLTGVAAV